MCAIFGFLFFKCAIFGLQVCHCWHYIDSKFKHQLNKAKYNDMSQSSVNISIRQLNKNKLKRLLAYGDIGKIALRTQYHYQHVSRVIRDGAENDNVWKAVADYIDSLPTAELSTRTAKLLDNEQAA